MNMRRPKYFPREESTAYAQITGGTSTLQGNEDIQMHHRGESQSFHDTVTDEAAKEAHRADRVGEVLEIQIPQNVQQ